MLDRRPRPDATPATEPTTVITASGWGWRYAGRPDWAVRGVDLTIEDGERVLLGASGAGKSTVLAALTGVLGSADEKVLIYRYF